MDSRFITTAFSGTTNDRNTAISRTNDSTSTPAITHTRRRANWAETSMAAAVTPPT